jgi:hypothetical protein
MYELLTTSYLSCLHSSLLQAIHDAYFPLCLVIYFIGHSRAVYSPISEMQIHTRVL